MFFFRPRAERELRFRRKCLFRILILVNFSFVSSFSFARLGSKAPSAIRQASLEKSFEETFVEAKARGTLRNFVISNIYKFPEVDQNEIVRFLNGTVGKLSLGDLQKNGNKLRLMVDGRLTTIEFFLGTDTIRINGVTLKYNHDLSLPTQAKIFAETISKAEKNALFPFEYQKNIENLFIPKADALGFLGILGIAALAVATVTVGALYLFRGSSKVKAAPLENKKYDANDPRLKVEGDLEAGNRLSEDKVIDLQSQIKVMEGICFRVRSRKTGQEHAEVGASKLREDLRNHWDQQLVDVKISALGTCAEPKHKYCSRIDDLQRCALDSNLSWSVEEQSGFITSIGNMKQAIRNQYPHLDRVGPAIPAPGGQRTQAAPVSIETERHKSNIWEIEWTLPSNKGQSAQ